MRFIGLLCLLLFLVPARADAISFGPDTPTSPGLFVFGATNREVGWGVGLGISYAWLPTTGWGGIELAGSLLHHEFTEESQSSQGGRIATAERGGGGFVPIVRRR